MPLDYHLIDTTGRIKLTKYFDRYLDDEGFFVSYHPYAGINVVGIDYDAVEKRNKVKKYEKTFECEFCQRPLGKLVNKRGRTTGYYCVYCNTTTTTRDAKNLKEITVERKEESI
jgi:hypothetical protein